jgi:hypothetical protein
MSLELRVTMEGLGSEELARLATTLADPSGLHAQIAGDAEIFVKARGRQTAATEHRTAGRLGAAPTGHLEQAYDAIEGTHDAAAAMLLVPRASRLRAAFGRYVLTPQNGSKYLTIPVAAEAYGKRAREIADLFFMRTGPGGTPVLARRVEGNKDQNLRTRTNQRRGSRRFTQAEVLYVLVQRAEIPEDTGLIPFEELAETARMSAEEYLDSKMEEALA